MNAIEHSAAYTAGWFADRFEEKLEVGDLVYVEPYGRSADTAADGPWHRLTGAGFVGTVSAPPTATSALGNRALENGIAVTPYVPEPAGDQYAIAHPLFVERGEKAVTTAGRSFLVQHTVELITPDRFRHMPEIGSEVEDGISNADAA